MGSGQKVISSECLQWRDSHHKSETMELLCPAGNLPALKTAIDNGAEPRRLTAAEDFFLFMPIDSAVDIQPKVIPADKIWQYLKGKAVGTLRPVMIGQSESNTFIRTQPNEIDLGKVRGLSREPNRDELLSGLFPAEWLLAVPHDFGGFSRIDVSSIEDDVTLQSVEPYDLSLVAAVDKAFRPEEVVKAGVPRVDNLKVFEETVGLLVNAKLTIPE